MVGVEQPEDAAHEEDEEDFCGFLQDDVKDHGDWVRHQVAKLNVHQEFIDQYVAAAPASVAAGSSKLDTSTLFGIPEPAPLDDIMDDLPSDPEDVPVDCEFPLDLLYLIPDPLNDIE